MAKRGRKPSKRKGYFLEEEEQAVLDYLQTDDAAEKNRIYTEKLKPAFEKMIESIIRRYKLFLNEEYEDTFNDTLSNLLTKLDKFKPEKDKKAYSYYGTLCKNYLLGRIDAQKKQSMRNPSYDGISEEFNTIRYSDVSDRSTKIAIETIDSLVKRMKNMVDNPEENNLKVSEVKLGKALINLFENWDYVLTTDASEKLNKNAILLFLRESTGLDTKGVRDNMKKFKKEFLIIKDYVIS